MKSLPYNTRTETGEEEEEIEEEEEKAMAGGGGNGLEDGRSFRRTVSKNISSTASRLSREGGGASMRERPPSGTS